jgi:hypothetical protein
MAQDGQLVRDRTAWVLVLAPLVAWPLPAWAAGGADIVDDAFVETPGVCHVESWRVEANKSASLTHLDLGCTPPAFRHLELGGAIERGDNGGPSGWNFSPTVKYTLFARPSAVALGISTSIVVNRKGRMTATAINVPLSISRGKYTVINLNAGWHVTRNAGVPVRNRASWGAQISQAVAPHVMLIGEAFGMVGDRPGGQGGVRWSPGRQKVDLDLRGSCGPGSGGKAITLGITVRI